MSSFSRDDGKLTVIPAIDLKGGRCVRLRQGVAEDATVYGDDPVALDIPVEVGGGLRTDDDVRATLDLGVSRAIIGTRAISDPAALARLVSEFGGERIAVGIDARGGLVQVNGWVETTAVKATELARRVADCGVGTIIYTDTATDGMLSGPSLGPLSEVADAAPECSIVASGGISAPKDLAAIVALGRKNINGAIVGKALYDGRTTLAALEAAIV